MKIDPAKNLISSLDPRTQSTERPEPRGQQVEQRETPQGDRIDISLKRELININDLSPEAAEAAVSKLDADRIAEIRQRIQSGYYGTDAALKQAAEGILQLFSA